jgi:hypothetical protein
MSACVCPTTPNSSPTGSDSWPPSGILDRGTLSDWRALYRLAAHDPTLRSRIRRLVLTVPLPLPRFWLAALASLGEPVDWDAPVPDYYESAGI